MTHQDIATTETSPPPFPSDFRVILISAQDYLGQTKTPCWNHGHTSGVAISKDRHLVVYWAEDW